MFRIFVLVAFVGLAAADVKHILPHHHQKIIQLGGQNFPPPLKNLNGNDAHVIQILRQDQVVNPDGSYQWAYETENEIKAEEQGQQKQIGEEAGNAAQGQFSYVSPEGEQIQVIYVADENGFQPQGAHIPTPPPVPAEILKSLEWNAAHPEEEVEDKQPTQQ